MAGTKLTRIRRELVDIVDQLAQLHEHREGLLEANSLGELDRALEDVEHSLDAVKGCVAALKYRIGLDISGPEHWGT